MFELAWSKNGTPNTLSSSGDDCDITDLTAYKFNQFLFHKIVTGAANIKQTFNNNSNSVYANRYSANGGADVTLVSKPDMETNHYSTDSFVVNYVCSISGEEKLSIWFKANQGTAGASNAPNRVEMVHKFVPSPDADITRIDMNNTAGGSYDTDSNLSALGTD